MKKCSVFLTVVLIVLAVAQAAIAQETCEQYGTISVANGEYKLQNSVWGATTRQCIRSTGGTGFTVSVSEHNQGSVAGYPSIYKGCHWGDCTTNSGMPILVSQLGSAPMSFSVSSARPAGTYNVATEAWLSPNQDSSGGYSGGCELMIILDYHGMYPAGSQVGTFNGYSVYYTNIGWNFVTYVKTGTSSVSINIKDFINDAISRGYCQTSWYLHAYEAGFELMSGGAGLTANSFSFSVSGGGTVTNPPTQTPAPTTAPSQTAVPTTAPSATAAPGQTAVPTAVPSATAVPGGSGTCTCSAGCSSATAVSAPYARDGAANVCLTMSSIPSYINSWNLTTLNVNGVDFTNKWAGASSLPAKINGLYYIYLNGAYAWSHFEAK